jgi:hypothetical protein
MAIAVLRDGINEYHELSPSLRRRETQQQLTIAAPADPR